jgi:hypothetical protein
VSAPFSNAPRRFFQLPLTREIDVPRTPDFAGEADVSAGLPTMTRKASTAEDQFCRRSERSADEAFGLGDGAQVQGLRNQIAACFQTRLVGCNSRKFAGKRTFV